MPVFTQHVRRHSRRLRARAIARRCTALIGFVLASLIAHAQGTADEAGIRTAMLINMARFTEWPAWKMDAGHPQFLICILGADPIDRYAERILDHQTINDKPVSVRHLKSGDAIEPCHVLYVSVANRKYLAQSQAKITCGAVLTVSELSNDITRDQMVGLPVDGDHIRIEINLTLAQRSGLRISSRILRIASVTP